MNIGDKKIFATLFFSIFATVTGVGIVIPLLPIYAHELGASGFYIGMIFGSFSLARTFFLPYFGRLSDRRGRKPLIVPALLAYAAISLGFIVFTDINALIFLRFLQGIASAMLMPIIQAYIGDITPPGKEGFTMGLFNMSMFSGLSIGPFLGGVIHDRFSLQTSFASMGLLALIGFFLCLLLLPPTQSEKGILVSEHPFSWKTLVYDWYVAGLFTFRLAYLFCVGIIWGFIPLYADRQFAASSSLIGILIMLGVFVSGLIHIPMGYLADRISKKLMVVIGGLTVSYAIHSFGWADQALGLILASIFFGLGGGISMPALTAMVVVKGRRINAMGSIMALMTMAHSLGMLSGALVGGMMMDFFNLQTAFPLGGGVMLISTGLFLAGTHPVKTERYQ